jgi:hypothetical protein
MSNGLWKVLGNPTITPELQKTLVDGVAKEAGKRSVQALAESENEVIVELLRLRAQHG